MVQTKKQSLIESIANILVGYFVALFSQIIIFNALGLNVPIYDNILIGIFLTITSLIRSYLIRRWFNGRA